MFDRKYAPLAFGFLLSGAMSLLVSGVATWRAAGLADGFARAWMGSWITAWPLAFPVVLLVAPLARKAVERLVRP